MYRDDSTAFGGHQFFGFRQLCEFRHEQIHVVWDVDMNKNEEVLAFFVGTMKVPARHDDKLVTCEIWKSSLADVKSECADTTQQPLKCRFPAQGVLDAMGVIFPQYRRDEKVAQISYGKHLNVLKEHLGQPRWIGESENKRLVAPVLDCFQFELQQPLFKHMVSNAIVAMEPPFQVNPLTKL